MNVIAIHTTVPSVEQARAMAHALVERGLAACVQIDPIESVYRWQGSVHQEAEYRLVCKTLRSRRDALMRVMRELHPYEVPQLLCFAVESADPAYAQWVAQCCGGGE